MSSNTLELSVVTPERSIVSGIAVEAIVLPGANGQLTILPGHINFLTSLALGAFGYKINGEWQVAFLTGGFAQVFQGKATVLAETMEMSNELNVAESELALHDIQQQLKALKAGTEEYSRAVAQKDLFTSRLRAAQKKLH